uniref:Uncharacterized protein n=1 Tax=Anopheles maculatus TaxID=74869 RepID=A0A182T1C2_9DIPT
MLNQEEGTITEIFTEVTPFSDQYPTSDDEESFFFEDWFSTTVSLDGSVTAEENFTDTPEEIGTFSEMPLYNVEEEDWYSDELESKLRIEYTPYSALLYQEDEFGLEFLCPGYWLKRGVLLVRGDFWPKDVV